MTDSLFWSRDSIVPQDQANFPQQIGFDPETGDLYLTQAEDSGAGYENLTISRFVGSTFVSMMTGLQGHGTPLLVEHQGTTTYLTFPYRGAASDVHWVRLPFIAGANWTPAQALAAQYRTNPLPTHPPAASKWMQGEVEFENAVFRLVGGPFNSAGPTMDGGPAELQVIRNGIVARTVDASMLGRIGMAVGNPPINDRLEPEGLALWYSSLAPILVVAIANGRADNDTLLVRTYAYGLDQATFIDDDAPATMLLGTTAQVHVTMLNSGDSTWTPELHFLAEARWSQIPADPLDPFNSDSNDPVWGTTFYSLSSAVRPGEQATFTFPVTGTIPLDDFQWQMVRDPWNGRHFFGSDSGRTHITVVRPPTNDAQYVGCEGVPAAIPADGSAGVAVLMRNIGNTTWSAATGYRLGAVGDDFGSSRHELPTDITPGQEVRIVFTIPPPAGSTATFQWRMVQDGHEWFGMSTDQFTITRTEAQECNTLRQQIAGLRNLRTGLQEELQHASPAEKPQIAAEIREVSAEIARAEDRMDTLGCQNR